MTNPLPNRRAGNFGGGRVFHQPVNWYAAVAVNPRFDILQRDANAVTHTVFGAATGARLEQVFCSDRRIVGAAVQMATMIVLLPVMAAEGASIGVFAGSLVSAVLLSLSVARLLRR